MSDYRREVSSFIKAVRLKKGWKQGRLAYAAGCAASTISRAENESHDMEYSSVLALAAAAGMTVPDALTDAYCVRRAPEPRKTVADRRKEAERLVRAMSPSELEAFINGRGG